MADEIVVVTTPDVSRKMLIVNIIDSTGGVVNVTGGSVRMQGTSSDLPLVTLDVAGVLTNPTQGVVMFPNTGGLGQLVTQAQLTAANVAQATFLLRIKYIDAAVKTDYGPLFELKWVKDPLVL